MLSITNLLDKEISLQYVNLRSTTKQFAPSRNNLQSMHQVNLIRNKIEGLLNTQKNVLRLYDSIITMAIK